MALPGTSLRFRRRLTHSTGLLMLALLTGCGEGDFGRIRSSLVIDDIHSWMGPAAVGAVGIPPSFYGLTDDERELRDLAYPLIQAPFDRQRWYSILQEYGIDRILGTYFDRTAYCRELLLRPPRSPASRYALLIEDIRNDLTRIGPFFRVAARVSDMDNKRAQSLPYITDLAPEEVDSALSRIAENRLIVGWVQHSLNQRVDAYRYALERLVIAYPSAMAVEAERVLNRLKLEIGEVQLVALRELAPSRRRVSK